MQVTPIFAIIFLIYIGNGEAFKFSGNTGVTFSPYVSSKYTDQNYTLEHVKTMIKVISQRFTTISVTGPIVHEDTADDFHSSNAFALTVKAALMISKERQTSGWSPLALHLDVTVHENPARFHREFSDALTLEQSNPGVVRSFVLVWNSTYEDINYMRRLLAEITQYKKGNRTLLGLELDCQHLDKSQGEDQILMVKIVEKLNFVVCQGIPGPSFSNQPDKAFAEVAESFMHYQTSLKEISSETKFSGKTEWIQGASKDDKQEVMRMKQFWEAADQWALNNSSPIWIMEAIDNPNRKDHENHQNHANHLGWWTLKDDTMIGNENGYIEKVAMNDSKPHTTVKPTTQKPSSSARPTGTGKGKSSATNNSLNAMAVYAIIFMLTLV